MRMMNPSNQHQQYHTTTAAADTMQQQQSNAGTPTADAKKREREEDAQSDDDGNAAERDAVETGEAVSTGVTADNDDTVAVNAAATPIKKGVKTPKKEIVSRLRVSQVAENTRDAYNKIIAKLVAMEVVKFSKSNSTLTVDSRINNAIGQKQRPPLLVVECGKLTESGNVRITLVTAFDLKPESQELIEFDDQEIQRTLNNIAAGEDVGEMMRGMGSALINYLMSEKGLLIASKLPLGKYKISGQPLLSELVRDLTVLLSPSPSVGGNPNGGTEDARASLPQHEL